MRIKAAAPAVPAAQAEAPETFRQLVPDAIKVICDVGTPTEYKAGEIIYRKGLPADRVYVVLEGEVMLRLPSDHGPDIIDERLSAGAIFGASALLGENYMVTAQCATGCKVLGVEIASLRQVMNSNAQVGFAIERHIAEVYYRRYVGAVHKVETILGPRVAAMG